MPVFVAHIYIDQRTENNDDQQLWNLFSVFEFVFTAFHCHRF